MRVIYDYYLRFRVRGQVASETLENLPMRFIRVRIIKLPPS